MNKNEIKNFTKKVPEDYNKYSIFLKDINNVCSKTENLLVPKKNKQITIAGSTSGIGKKISELYKKEGIEITEVGSRNKKTNNDENFIGGDLFEKGTDAYNYYTNVLAERKEGGVEHIISGINMDREYVIVDKQGNIVEGSIDEYIDEKLNIKEEYKERFEIIKDYYDPRTGKKWNNEELSDGETLEDKRASIRKEMADKQIIFWENMLISLIEGEKKETPLTITFANSIGSKFYENHSVKKAGSEYGRLKKEISEISRKYFDKLKEKNIYIKNVIIPVVDSEMWTTRSDLNSKLTGNIVEGIGFTIPLDGEPIIPNPPLEVGDVAKVFFEIGKSNPSELPSTIVLLDENYLNINNQKEKYQKDKINIIKKITEYNIDIYNNKITINEKTKEFLINFRKDALNTYIIKEKTRIEELYNNEKISAKQKKLKLKMLEKITKDNNSNIIEGNNIINGLDEEISYEKFIEICIILEKNYS